jgi:hypothetical protein
MSNVNGAQRWARYIMTETYAGSQSFAFSFIVVVNNSHPCFPLVGNAFHTRFDSISLGL